MQLRYLLLALLISISMCLQAQPPSYPKGYFRDPLGIPIVLSANLGELRPDHWHMGLDIRTDQRENLPVYAVADGYIAHIGIRPESFGRFIIIAHPNGLSTLYAHLNDFFPELEQYVTEQQYKQERWAIELDLPQDKFPVQKSQFIAYSGTTGGSQGPHLHFEIFDSKTEKRYNPLLFGLLIPDNVPPDIVKLAMYDRSKSVYETTPQFFYLKNTGNGYIISKTPLIKTGLTKLSFAIQAYDRMSGTDNPNGIYSATLFLDGEPQVSFLLDNISYEETVYVNANIDYKYRANGGSFLQHLSQLPGDHGGVYQQIKGDGVITLSDTTVHTVHIEVKDANDNLSQLNFAIQYNGALATPVMDPHQTDPFAPNKTNDLVKPDFGIHMPAATLYDSIRPMYYRNPSSAVYAVSDIHQVNDASIPLHNDITVRIKPDRTIPEEWENKIVIQRSSKGTSVRKAEWQNDHSTNTQWLTARFGDLGIFQAFADILPPQINDPGSYRGGGDTIDLSSISRIVFHPTDNFNVIKDFRVELDGHWLRFTNDKGKNWIYIFDDRCPYGVHELQATVKDLVGNTTTKSWWFRRYPYSPPKKKVVKKGGGTKKNKVKIKKTVSK